MRLPRFILCSVGKKICLVVASLLVRAPHSPQIRVCIGLQDGESSDDDEAGATPFRSISNFTVVAVSEVGGGRCNEGCLVYRYRVA